MLNQNANNRVKTLLKIEFEIYYSFMYLLSYLLIYLFFMKERKQYLVFASVRPCN